MKDKTMKEEMGKIIKGIHVEDVELRAFGTDIDEESLNEALEKLLSLFNQEKIEMLEGLKMEKKVQPIPKSNREAVEGFVYHYWCYNPSTGTSIYPDSVELDVVAGSETEALKIAKKMVKDRGTYKLQTVSNLSQLNKENDYDNK